MSAPSHSDDTLRLIGPLDQGPVSAVFVAHQLTWWGPRPVAVKVIRTRFLNDARILASIRDHGRALNALSHHNLLGVTDVAQVDDRLALVTPLVDGIDLRHWTEALYADNESLPGRVCCEIVKSVAVALDAAATWLPHDGAKPLGRHHGDLKPSNVLVCRDGRVLVLDHGSGLSALAGRDARSGALQHGLAKYLSPARRNGKRGGETADVYALGIMATELFSRRWLKRLRSSNPAHDRHLSEVVARIENTGMRTQADEDKLRSALLRMTAHDPDARPTIQEVARTFLVLAERAQGQGLERFVGEALAPRLPPFPDPEALVTRRAARVLDDDALVAANIEHPEAPRTPIGDRKSDRTVWEETSVGWQEAATWEYPEELSAADFDETPMANDIGLGGSDPDAEWPSEEAGDEEPVTAEAPLQQAAPMAVVPPPPASTPQPPPVVAPPAPTEPLAAPPAAEPVPSRGLPLMLAAGGVLVMMVVVGVSVAAAMLLL